MQNAHFVDALPSAQVRVHDGKPFSHLTGFLKRASIGLAPLNDPTVSGILQSDLTPTCSNRSINSRTVQFQANQFLPSSAASNASRVTLMNFAVSLTTDQRVRRTGGVFGFYLIKRTPLGMIGTESLVSSNSKTASR